MPHGGRRSGAGRKARAKPDLEPAGSSAVELFLTNRDFEKLVGDLFRLARTGDEEKIQLEAIRLLLYYRDGKPRQRHEITGPDGESLFDPRDELLAILARLAPAG